MGGNAPGMQTPQTAGTAYRYVPKQGDIGKEKTCPVNGEPLVVKADTPAITYKGKIYYFCCAACERATGGPIP